MPLVRSAIRRAGRKGEASSLLVAEWRNRDLSERRCLVVELADMHCSAHHQQRPDARCPVRFNLGLPRRMRSTTDRSDGTRTTSHSCAPSIALRIGARMSVPKVCSQRLGDVWYAGAMGG
jgi:hypothetical protein